MQTKTNKSEKLERFFHNLPVSINNYLEKKSNLNNAIVITIFVSFVVDVLLLQPQILIPIYILF